mmetsp:Transcript_25451/g.46128  ORF Transcript_25451/g.46128 Transcript_25451/m.46128 type:complete len:202 (+) Transcript_25451:309-914(+)
MFLQGHGSEFFVWIRGEHVFDGIILADSSCFGCIFKGFRVEGIRDPLEGVDNDIKQPKGCIQEIGFLPNSLVQHFSLFLHGERFIWTAQINDFIFTFLVGDGIKQVGGKVGFANGVAPGHFSVAKHDKRCSTLNHFELSRDGFEKGSRTDNGIGHVGLCLNSCLQLEFGLLELQPWILDTKGTQQHIVSSIHSPSCIQTIE